MVYVFRNRLELQNWPNLEINLHPRHWECTNTQILTLEPLFFIISLIFIFLDMKDVDDELADVEKVLKNQLSTAQMITDTFNEVYEMLLHLQGVVAKEQFDKCYNKASEIFYLATGFKDQVQDCIAVSYTHLTLPTILLV